MSVATSLPENVQVVRYTLPLAPDAGVGAPFVPSSLLSVPGAADAGHQPGSLRVRLLEAEGLAARADGSACEPYVTVSVAELTRRRTRRTDAKRGVGGVVAFEEAFDFEATSACAQVVVDVWDRPAAGAPASLLGKAVLGVGECRAGVPHTYFKHLLEGKLVLRLLFDFAPLPSEADELAQYQAEYAAALAK